MTKDPLMFIYKVKSTSVFVDAVVEYLGEAISMVYTSEEGWQIDQEIDHYGWDELRIDQCFELARELPEPRVYFEKPSSL